MSEETKIEARYLRLTRVAQGLAGAADVPDALASLGEALGSHQEPVALRLWVFTPEGPRELGRSADARFVAQDPRLLTRALQATDPVPGAPDSMLLGLATGGHPFAVLELPGDAILDYDLVADAAPLIASGVSALSRVDTAYVPPLDRGQTASSAIGYVMEAFTHEVRRIIDHDRLSIYLVTPEGRAVERFPAEDQYSIPGEGILFPFGDFGLRHVLLTNRPLVSDDLGGDTRIVGREDRVIARAGFHGLLSVPLRLDGRPFGVLNFVSRHPGHYTAEDSPIAEQIGDLASVFIHYLRVHERLLLQVREQAIQHERRRFAQDLHVVVADSLPAVRKDAGRVTELVGSEFPATAAAAARLARRVDAIQASLERAVTGELPPALASGSLATAIDTRACNFEVETGITTEVTTRGDSTALPRPARLAVYRIFEEALSNVGRHSGAERVSIDLAINDDLRLTVADDGHGLSDMSPASNGFGIRSMTMHAVGAGGILTLDSNGGRGTAVRLNLPGIAELPDRIGIPGEGMTNALDALGHAGAFRIVLADRSPILRAGIEKALEPATELRIVGEAETADELRVKVGRLRPDLVVLAAELGDGGLTDIISEVHASSENSGVLILVDDHNLAPATMSSDISGVIRRDSTRSDFVDAVLAVARGERLTATGSGLVAQRDGQSPHGVTPRELAILTFVAQGKTNAEIGEALFLASKTVERHLATLMRKLQARNRAHVVARAAALRLIDVESA